MAYSIYTAYGDGVTNQFTISFGLGYIDKADVKCRVNKEVDGLGAPVYRSLTWITDSLVQVGGTVPANGNLVEFIRTVSKTSLVHDYSDGVEIQEKNLDDSNKQTLMAVQEVLDGRFESGLATDLDFANHKAINVATGTNLNDAVNLAQLQDMTGNAPAYAAAAAASAATATTQAGIATTQAGIATTQAGNAAISAASAAASAAGMKLKAPARAATTAALPTCTYNNGTAGVGATLTATTNGALAAQDGVTLVLGETLLVKNQASTFQNGIYVLTQVGSGSLPWILTRQTDSDTWNEIYAASVTVAEGTTQADRDFLCTSNSGGTMGSTAITWIDKTPTTIVDGAVSTAAKIVDGIITFVKFNSLAIASLADWASGTASKLLTADNFLAAIFAALGVNKYYESAEQTYTAVNEQIVVTHSLGGIPKELWVVLRCKTAEAGYSVGDELALSTLVDGGNTNNLFTIGASSTQCWLSKYPSFYVNLKNGSSAAALTPANWRIVFRARI